MAKINLLAGNRLNVQFGSTPNDAVVVSNAAGPARKGIVGGKIVIEENYGKGIVGGSIFIPEETVAQLGDRWLINVGGKVYQAAATERLVNIGGRVYYEYAQATGTDVGAPIVVTIGGASETDTAGTVVSVNPRSYSVTGASETDTAGVVEVDTGIWYVSDVDTDESISDGQVGVVVTIVGSVAASGKRVFLEQGGTLVEQTTITNETANTITFTVDYGSLTAGAANLQVWNPL